MVFDPSPPPLFVGHISFCVDVLIQEICPTKRGGGLGSRPQPLLLKFLFVLMCWCNSYGCVTRHMSKVVREIFHVYVIGYIHFFVSWDIFLMYWCVETTRRSLSQDTSLKSYVRFLIWERIHLFLCCRIDLCCVELVYGVALASRIDKILGLFCKRAL